MHSETPVVSVIRRSSRLMVRELGFMGSTRPQRITRLRPSILWSKLPYEKR
jgi:hypothetical protein